MSLNEKWKKDELVFARITNEKLTCKNCKFKMDDSEIFGNTIKCEQFTVKPRSVLKGSDCVKKEAV